MQGIVGQASDLGPSTCKCILWQDVSFFDQLIYGLHDDVWWRKIEKAKATDEQCYGTVFCVNTIAHARAQPSYEFRLYVFGKYARWRECQDSLSCWTGLALANEKDDERWRKELTRWVKTTAQYFAASAGLKRNCLSKNKSPFVAELSMSCRRSVHDCVLQWRWRCFVG